MQTMLVKLTMKYEFVVLEMTSSEVE